MGFNVICPFSLIVAALQVFTLNVPSAVVCARELDPIFVHAPADAPFASARWLALWDRTQDCRLDKKKKAWSDHKVAQQNVLLCLCKKKKVSRYGTKMASEWIESLVYKLVCQP